MNARDRWVYVIGNAESRLVKIGSTRDVAQRLANLQVGSPTPLHLLLTVRTNRHAERALHERFAPYRRHGEWFDFGDLDPATEVCFAIGAIGTTPEVAAKRQAVVPRPEPVPVGRYVAALIDAGIPPGLGRQRVRSWAKSNGVALPGKTERVAVIVTALRAAQLETQGAT